MKSARVLIPALVLMLVGGMVFAGGSKEATTPMAATAPSGPAYGGTLTLLIPQFAAAPPTSWNPTKAAGPSIIVYSNPVMQQALVGDVAKYGFAPGGAKKYQFDNIGWIPAAYYKGELVTSWDWPNPLTIVFHVRKGVYFSGISANPGVMKPRELVASDFVYQLDKMMNSKTKGPNWTFWVKSTSAPSKFTWVVHLKKYYSGWQWWLASAFMQIFPRETYQAGASNWRNLVGTGPFTLSHFVRGSYTIYKRNPNYWGKVTIGGKTYQEPFISKLVYPDIPTVASQIAALRTGKIDLDTSVDPRYVSTLAKTSPNLARYPYYAESKAIVFQTSTSKYLQNEQVRRALTVGTDLQTMGQDLWGAGNFSTNPLRSSALYVPIAQMPASVRELYTYDPTKAKQMLAQAGYPNGFTIQMSYNATSQTAANVASLVSAQWAKLGVTVQLHALQPAVMVRYRYDHSYTDSLISARGYGSSSVSMKQGLYGSEEDTSAWNNPSYSKDYVMATSKLRNATDALALEKKMVLQMMNAAPMIAVPPNADYVYAWPWVRNYYGAINAGFTNPVPIIDRVWIDQNMKKKMGY